MNNVKKILNTKIAVWALCCSMLLPFTGCIDDGPTVPEKSNLAYVLLYHGSPNAPALDIEVDNNQINSTGFAYAEASAYLNFFPGERNLKFGPVSSSSITVDTTVTFEANQAYSVFFADEFENAEVIILSDTSEATTNGKADIRVINLSPDAGAIDFKVSGAASNFVSDLDFKDAIPFTRINSGSYNFEVRASDDDELLLSIPGKLIESRYFYTIVIRGYDTPPAGNTNVLAAQVIVN